LTNYVGVTAQNGADHSLGINGRSYLVKRLRQSPQKIGEDKYRIADEAGAKAPAPRLALPDASQLEPDIAVRSLFMEGKRERKE
jgi:hypothetical protein